MEREIDGRISATSAVMRLLYRITVMVKKKPSQKANLSVYRSIYIPPLTYGHELWVVSSRTKMLIQLAKNETRWGAGSPSGTR